MPVDRFLTDISIHVEHPRQPEPSYARLYAMPAWLKGDLLVYGNLTEDDCFRIAEQALRAGNTLRRLRMEREARA
jgi:hypothetical protein